MVVMTSGLSDLATGHITSGSMFSLGKFNVTPTASAADQLECFWRNPNIIPSKVLFLKGIWLTLLPFNTWLLGTLEPGSPPMEGAVWESISWPVVQYREYQAVDNSNLIL